MRANIDRLVIEAKQKDFQIAQEQARLMREKEEALQRYKEAVKKEELAELEKQRIKEAKNSINLRYASIPQRSDGDYYGYLQKLAESLPSKKTHVTEIHHHHGNFPMG